MNFNNIAGLLQDELENILTDMITSQDANEFIRYYQNRNTIDTSNNESSNVNTDRLFVFPTNNTNPETRSNSNGIFTTINSIPNLLRTPAQGNVPPAQGTAPSNTTQPPPSSTQPNTNHRRSYHTYDPFDSVELYDTLYHLHMNMHEYNTNYQGYQRNVESIIQVLTEQSRRNYAPRRQYTPTNGFDLGSNISYFLYNPLRRHPANRMNTTATTAAGLSQEIIQLATRIVPYTPGFTEPRCPITLEDFEIGENIMQIIPCGHIFKVDALNNWFRRDNKCPCCRFDINSFIVSGIVNEGRNVSRHNSIDGPPAISVENRDASMDVDMST